MFLLVELGPKYKLHLFSNGNTDRIGYNNCSYLLSDLVNSKNVICKVMVLSSWGNSDIEDSV